MFSTVYHQKLFNVIKKLLPAWEQKTYQEKIEFWKEEAFEHFTDKVSISRHDVFCNGYIAVNPKKNGKPNKVSISILPSNNDELKQYLDFLRKEIEKPESKLFKHYSFNVLVNDFETKLKKGKGGELERVKECIAIHKNNIELRLHKKFVYPYADLTEKVKNIGEIHNPYEYIPTLKRAIVLQPCYTAGFNHVWYGEELKFESFTPYFDLNGKPDLTHVNFLSLYLGMRDADFLHYLENLMKELKIKVAEGIPLSKLPKLQWKDENKTELSMLIVSLYRSKRILADGMPIEQKELKRLFEKLFSIELDNLNDLVRAGITTNKATFDKKHFLNELKDLIEKKV